jgi:TonB family protein
MKKLAFVVAMFVAVALQAQVVPGVVTGQLLPRDGQPVAGVRISAMAVPDSNVAVSAASTLMSLTVTDSAGRYRLENVPPGRYYIIAGLVETPTYYPGVPTTSSATAVAVTAGATVPNINFPMVIPLGVSVSGRVIRPANPGVLTIVPRVALLGSAPPVIETALNSDGSFQFTKVRPGTYNLMVSGATLAQPLNVIVTDKDISGLEAVVIATVLVTGNLVVEGNGLLPRFSLTLSPFRGGTTAPSPFIQPTGVFQTQIPEGEYRIGWSALPAGYLLKSITSGNTDLLSTPLKVMVGSSMPPVVVTLGVTSPPPWVKVSGRVKGLPANASTLPRLAIASTAVAETLEVSLRPDGSFEFPRVLPGTYSGRFNPPLPVSVPPILVGNKDVDSVEITIPPMRELVGRVVVEGLGAITPRLTFTWTDAAAVTNVLGASALAVNQPDGTFKVTLPEGERRVSLTAPGYTVRALTYGGADLLRVPLKVTAANSEEFRVTLVPSATGVPGGVVGGVVGGVLGGILAPILTAAPPPPLPVPQPTSSQGTPTRIGGDVAQSNLVSSVQPKYPEPARAARVTGVVLLQVVINREGAVENINVISGHSLLTDAAVEAVKQWRYKPQATPTVTTVTVNFTMQ